MAKKLPIVVEENWETYVYHMENGPVFATFYAGVDTIERDNFPFCARIIIPIADPNENGGPKDGEAEILWGLEDQLVEVLTQYKVPCLMVGRLTHSGSRELVFQVADWESFRPPVGAWLEDTTDYEIDVSEHDGWDFFVDCVWPGENDWRLIHNQKVVDGLIEAGSDPEKEHALEFVFRGEPDALKKVKASLLSRGYVEGTDPTEADLLVMVKHLPLDLDLIADESFENQRLGEEFDVEFDGWGAAVVS